MLQQKYNKVIATIVALSCNICKRPLAVQVIGYINGTYATKRLQSDLAIPAYYNVIIDPHSNRLTNVLCVCKICHVENKINIDNMIEI